MIQPYLNYCSLIGLGNKLQAINSIFNYKQSPEDYNFAKTCNCVIVKKNIFLRPAIQHMYKVCRFHSSTTIYIIAQVILAFDFIRG